MNKIKLHRHELNLSQEELSQASGVPRYAIVLAEKNIRIPSIAHQQALAEALGIEEHKLFPSKLETRAK